MMRTGQRMVAILGTVLFLCAAALIVLFARQVDILPEKYTDYYTGEPREGEQDDQMNLLLQMLNQP